MKENKHRLSFIIMMFSSILGIIFISFIDIYYPKNDDILIIGFSIWIILEILLIIFIIERIINNVDDIESNKALITNNTIEGSTRVVDGDSHPVKFQTLFGETLGLPILVFWCKNCIKQVKIKNKEEKPQSCPECNNLVLVFYAKQNANYYYRFILAFSLIGGSFGIVASYLTNLVTIGDLDLSLLLLMIIEFVFGLIIFGISINPKITCPPSYACETLNPSIKNAYSSFDANKFLFLIALFSMLVFFINLLISILFL